MSLDSDIKRVEDKIKEATKLIEKMNDNERHFMRDREDAQRKVDELRKKLRDIDVELTKYEDDLNEATKKLSDATNEKNELTRKLTDLNSNKQQLIQKQAAERNK